MYVLGTYTEKILSVTAAVISVNIASKNRSQKWQDASLLPVAIEVRSDKMQISAACWQPLISNNFLVRCAVQCNMQLLSTGKLSEMTVSKRWLQVNVVLTNVGFSGSELAVCGESSYVAETAERAEEPSAVTPSYAQCLPCAGGERCVCTLWGCNRLSFSVYCIIADMFQHTLGHHQGSDST